MTVQQLTGAGAAAALVMANSGKAYQAALELLAPYGALVCVGIPPPDQLMSFHPLPFIAKGIRVIGSAVGTRKDIWDAIEFVDRGVVKPAIEMAKLEDLSDIAKNFGKVSAQGRVSCWADADYTTEFRKVCDSLQRGTKWVKLRSGWMLMPT